MKNTYLLLTAFACLLTACDQPTTPKADNTPATKAENTAAASDKPAAKVENTAAASDTPAAKAENAAAASDKPAAKAENTAAASDKPAAGDNKTDTAPPATPPTFKTAAEALPYLESLLPYDIADSSFRSVRLSDNTFTFTAVIKGVEDAAAFKAGHDMAALQTAYHKGSLPYLCAQEPLAILWAKKKIRSIRLDYQDEHGNPIMQYDIDAADCAGVEAPQTPITPKTATPPEAG